MTHSPSGPRLPTSNVRPFQIGPGHTFNPAHVPNSINYPGPHGPHGANSFNPGTSKTYSPGPGPISNYPGPHKRTPPNIPGHPFQDKVKQQQSSRIRLTIQALEALIQEPGRFHRIDFGDGKGHFFKKATTQDKVRYPKGEFFTARVHNEGELIL